MTEDEIPQLIPRAREKFPGLTPGIISENGSRFIAKAFK
jgi:hypothetical protein